MENTIHSSSTDPYFQSLSTFSSVKLSLKNTKRLNLHLHLSHRASFSRTFFPFKFFPAGSSQLAAFLFLCLMNINPKDLITVSFTLFAIIDIIGSVPLLI